MMKRLVVGIALVLVPCAFGCAAHRPVLYDNAAYKKDPAKANAAIEECVKRAEQQGVKGDKIADAAERAAKGGVASAAAGAAGAAGANAFGYNYDVGASAGASAAAGTAGNLALGLMDNDVDPGFANYVELCLAEKGYKTISWK